jgi:hypothetical protein
MSEWPEICFWMREPISLSSEVFVARNLRQNLLRFFWPEPARPAKNKLRPTVHSLARLVKGEIVVPWPF